MDDILKMPEFLFTRNQNLNQEKQEKQAILQESHDPNTEPTKMWQNLELIAHSNLTIKLGAFSSEWKIMTGKKEMDL